MEMNQEQRNKLLEVLNNKYDEIEKLDLQIDMMILKRNNLLNEVESGVAIILKYSQ